MYKNHTVVLNDDTVGGVRSFSRVSVFLKSAVSAVTDACKHVRS